MPRQTRPERRAYRVDETAEMVGVSVKTVRAWIRDGRLAAVWPSGRGPNRPVLVPASEIARLLDGEPEPERVPS
jgi:excisionase family DNA binding protein